MACRGAVGVGVCKPGPPPQLPGALEVGARSRAGWDPRRARALVSALQQHNTCGHTPRLHLSLPPAAPVPKERKITQHTAPHMHNWRPPRCPGCPRPSALGREKHAARRRSFGRRGGRFKGPPCASRHSRRPPRPEQWHGSAVQRRAPAAWVGSRPPLTLDTILSTTSSTISALAASISALVGWGGEG